MEQPLVLCRTCGFPETACFCAQIPQLSTKTWFLILQHPQEVRRPCGTAPILAKALENNVVFRRGLSWGSLEAALGGPVRKDRWAVMFLGTKKETAEMPGRFQTLGRDAGAKPNAYEGIVLLDGNWRQSKSLWWRNPWLLRLKRVRIESSVPSAIGSLRRQPRKDCLATMEAAAEALRSLEPKSAVPDQLDELMKNVLAAATTALPPAPKKRRPDRRRNRMGKRGAAALASKKPGTPGSEKFSASVPAPLG